MPACFVLTIVGPDRPGLVDAVASLVTAHQGNWLESRMSRLGGQFAGILRVEVPESQQRALEQAMQSLRDKGLAIVVVADSTSRTATEGRQCEIQLVGQDRPGIVRDISHALAGRGVNVEEFHSECESAPMSGEPLFKAKALVQVPTGCDLAALRQELEAIAADLIVDLSFSELK